VRVLTFDTENETYNKGSTFDQRFANVCISYAGPDGSGVFFGSEYGRFRSLWNDSDFVVGFNLKYDLHVLRRIGIELGDKRYWCCQLAQFLLNRQSTPWLSLDDCLETHGLPKKDTGVDEYWEKGILTSQIPREVLSQYAIKDAELTYQLYLKQRELVKPHQQRLFALSMQDLAVLEEIEWNGMRFDTDLAQKKEKEIEAEISSIQTKLSLYGTCPNFNWSSNEHLSALLFGGEIKDTIKVPNGYYKTGLKKGEIKFSNKEVTYKLPRLFKPLKKTEKGDYSVDEDTLLKLGQSDLLEGILRIKKLEKLKNTYYKGLVALCQKKNYKPGYIYSNFSQCNVATGRLSSNSPNLQNIPEEADDLFITRY
jgi:DNA polymerase I-like protein with 3'-5' exonuclease and polymerase domains